MAQPQTRPSGIDPPGTPVHTLIRTATPRAHGLAAQAADDARIAAYLGGADRLAKWLGVIQWVLIALAVLILIGWALQLLPGTTAVAR